MTKGNKGEWSEFYVFTKLLDEKKLFSADENLQINKDVFYPVLKVFRGDTVENRKIYDLESGDSCVRILNAEGSELEIVDVSGLKKKVKEIFEEISNAKSQRAFSIPVASEAMTALHCGDLKAASTKKADIILTIKDEMGTQPEVGYSIKSMIGAASTLLNPSGATNFIYRLDGLADEFADEINSTKSFKKKLKIIYENGGKIKFERVASEIFKNNLQLIDNTFHQALAEFLLNFYEGKGNKFEKLLEGLNQENIAEGLSVPANNYRHKIKNFLINVALGMVPNTEWDAYMKAYGGYIIVKKDGDVCCYQLYNRDKFQDYLYKNTKFDTPSTTKFDFGKVYQENGQKYIKLNLQIRFLR